MSQSPMMPQPGDDVLLIAPDLHPTDALHCHVRCVLETNRGHLVLIDVPGRDEPVEAPLGALYFEPKKPWLERERWNVTLRKPSEG